ncbi:hypothetical protein C8J56DRAFT_926570 [Mycena floridula]|nr:hypothetical protein C8J56DRAFT_926570 [Mycena floridula]
MISLLPGWIRPYFPFFRNSQRTRKAAAAHRPKKVLVSFAPEPVRIPTSTRRKRCQAATAAVVKRVRTMIISARVVRIVSVPQISDVVQTSPRKKGPSAYDRAVEEARSGRHDLEPEDVQLMSSFEKRQFQKQFQKSLKISGEILLRNQSNIAERLQQIHNHDKRAKMLREKAELKRTEDQKKRNQPPPAPPPSPPPIFYCRPMITPPASSEDERLAVVLDNMVSETRVTRKEYLLEIKDKEATALVKLSSFASLGTREAAAADARWLQENQERQKEFADAAEELRRERVMVERYLRYDAAWEILETEDPADWQISFAQFPWPLQYDISCVEDLNLETKWPGTEYSVATFSITQFIFHRFRKGFDKVTPRYRVLLELRRWDHLKLGSILSFVVEADRNAVKDGFRRVRRVLEQQLAKYDVR